ncbi:MAG: MCP four helix bundle domain-containing protein [Bacteroidia bacterium]
MTKKKRPLFRRSSGLAGSFALLFVFFIILGLFSTHGFDRISVSFRSMYEDRLVVGIDVSKLIILVYENRVALENHITTSNKEERQKYESQIVANYHQIDSLIMKVSATYLVPEEKSDLGLFTSNLTTYRDSEQKMLRMSRELDTDSALFMLTHKADELFHNTVRPLERLEKDQQKVGEQLYKESLETANNQKVLAYVIMFAATLSGIIFAFAFTYRKLDQY